MAEEVKNQTQVAVNFVDAIVSEVEKFKNAISLKKNDSKKNIFEGYQNQCKDGARSIITIEQYLEQQAGKEMSEENISRLKSTIENLVKHSSNINLALISGYRFVSSSTIISALMKKVDTEIFVSVGPAYIGTARWNWLPHGKVTTEDERDILNECNAMVSSIVTKYNELVPNNKIAIDPIDEKIEKFDDFIKICLDKPMLYTRKGLSTVTKSYKKYFGSQVAKAAGITVGIVVIGGVSYYIYENGWEETINQIKNIIPAKETTESTTDNNLFELEEIPVDDNVKEDIALYI